MLAMLGAWKSSCKQRSTWRREPNSVFRRLEVVTDTVPQPCSFGQEEYSASHEELQA